MPECTFHRGVETSVRCVECDRPICPKDFVPTPVGYKCPDCARPLPSARRTVKPRQLVLATLAALGVGVVGMLVVGLLGYRSWLLAIAVGLLTAEVTRRTSGGHRSTPVAVVAAVGVGTGALVTGMGPVMALVGAAAAAMSINSGRW
ncbi:MAG: hypothetical protein JXP72_04520 [Coriobacteriia bacterium]|nr:hypothetical protein [Coriobacteriia bacterium]